MSGDEPSATWLPTSAQIMMAPERAILASLDAALQLAVRVLQVEHSSLGERRRPGDEPEPPQLALAVSICILAESLHELIARYRAVTEHALGDADPDDEF